MIAGPKPPIDERRRVRLGIVLVAANHVGPLNDDLAALVPRQMTAARIHDADADVGAAPDRTRFTRLRRHRIRCHLMGRLGHPVRLEHRRAKCGFEVVHHLRRKRRAARTDKPQMLGALRRGRGQIGACEQQLMQRRDRRIPRRPVIAGHSPE